MSNNELAKLLIDTLPFPSPPKLFNPWRDHCPDCKPCNDPDAKLARLADHLDCEARFILCGEAPSHRGCRHSGIAFTSEYLLREGIPRIPAMSHRLTVKKSPYKEGSATTVWKVLRELRIEEHTILWNALPMHPHEQGNEQKNRRPIPDEVIKFGEPALKKLVEAFPSATIVAVGKIAERLLHKMGIDYKPVRHPSFGGAPEFTRGLKLLVAGAS
jgi:uracil-DNA glycosylase